MVYILMIYKMRSSGNGFYFITSSEFNAYQKQIKVNQSLVK